MTGKLDVPEVSIILPTYNRVDVIGRAIASIIRQTHTDWELLVVDDGSTDGTLARLQGLDPRIRLLSQPNQGVAAARNTGIAAAAGRYVAFMDSDDEWRPQFLALTTAFLRHHPDEHWVATESHEDLGDGGAPILHSRADIATTYCAFARSIGSHALDLPAGTRDDYLRVYQRCTPVGAWGRDSLDALGLDSAMVYHGRTLQHMRWGYLNWLPATVLTREALATGGGALRFERNKLACFDEAFDRRDPDIALLRRHNCLYVGHRALAAGHRAEAIDHLRQAACWRPILWRAWPMLALARLVPDDRTLARTYLRLMRGGDIVLRLLSGRLPPGLLLDKLRQRQARPAPADTWHSREPTLTDSALAPFESPRP